MIPVDASAPNTQLVPAFLKAEVLSEALPYIQRFHGKTIVIKYGGKKQARNFRLVDYAVACRSGGGVCLRVSVHFLHNA